MRLRNNDVLDMFINRRGVAENHTQNLYIDKRGILWNYATPIALYYNDEIYLNNRRYSSTTSKHQNYLRRNANVIEIDEVEIRDLVFKLKYLS